MNRWKNVMIVIVVLALASAAAAENHTTKTSDGTEIAYETWGDHGMALVFIHGWSCDRTYWRNQVEVFAKKHRVVAIDLAGHGESGTKRSNYTMTAFGADVVAVLKDAGIENAVLVGHSMGGPVAVEAAIQAPDRVLGIIGIDNFQSFTQEIPEGQIDALLGAFRENYVPVVGAWVKSMFPADADTALQNAVAADMAGGDQKVGLSAMNFTLRWMGGEGAARVVQLKCNITTVSSDMHPTEVEANRKLVPGFEARIMTGVGHFLMLEKPAEFNELLNEAVAEFGLD